jgi:GT2 family glycosyltransferase
VPRRARVIVAVYQQLPFLRRTLRGWLRQTSRDFALTVADDGSHDGTDAFLVAFAGECAARDIPFEHVWHEDLGFRKNAILNEAVRRSQGEPLLLFSDGDCIPRADFVAAHLEAHGPRTFQVGGAVRLGEEASASLTPADVDSGAFEALVTDADRRDLAARHRKTRWGTLLRRRNRPKVLGLHMGIDRALFEEANGFDERFTAVTVGEDTDLRDRVMRLRPRPRVRNLYLETWVYHLWHPQSPTDRRLANAEYYRSARPARCEVGLRRPSGGDASSPAP